MDDATRKLAVAIYNKGNDFTQSDRAYGFMAPDKLRAVELAQEKIATAQKMLDDIIEGIGLRVAVDALMPGWVDIDASEHLPREKWHAFLASTKAEWVAWLVENGMGEGEARTLVIEQWPKEPF